MQIRLNRFFLDEKDLFVWGIGLLFVLSFIFHIPLSPFRPESLLVVFLFLLVTRSMVESLKFGTYLAVALIGLALSVFLSPYGLIIYFLIAFLLYKKTNLL